MENQLREIQLEPGAYLADGARLYRVLLISAGRGLGPVITLEDCRTLELSACPLRELERRPLSLVREPDPG